MESGLGYGEGYCRSCGRRITSRDRFCQHCGRTNAVLDEELGHPGSAGMSGTGGLLLMVSALLSILSIIPIKSLMDSFDYPHDYFIASVFIFKDIFYSVLAALVVLAIIALIGGLAAHGRDNFGLAMAGGLASVFSIGGAIGLAGLLMIAASRNDFKSAKGEVPMGPQIPRTHGPSGGNYIEGAPADSLQKSLFIRR